MDFDDNSLLIGTEEDEGRKKDFGPDEDEVAFDAVDPAEDLLGEEDLAHLSSEEEVY